LDTPKKEMDFRGSQKAGSKAADASILRNFTLSSRTTQAFGDAKLLRLLRVGLRRYDL